MSIKNYIVSHWKGDISPIKGFLINFVGAYIVSVFFLFFLSQTLKIPFWLGMTVFSAVMIWAGVGTVRSTIKNIHSKSNSLSKKAIYFLIIGIIGSAIIVSIFDILRLFGISN